MLKDSEPSPYFSDIFVWSWLLLLSLYWVQILYTYEMIGLSIELISSALSHKNKNSCAIQTLSPYKTYTRRWSVSTPVTRIFKNWTERFRETRKEEKWPLIEQNTSDKVQCSWVNLTLGKSEIPSTSLWHDRTKINSCFKTVPSSICTTILSVLTTQFQVNLLRKWPEQSVITGSSLRKYVKSWFPVTEGISVDNTWHYDFVRGNRVSSKLYLLLN